jgi:glycosyltransferase involved in cell wall biosynthesis
MSETSESDNQRVWWKEWIKGWFVRKCDAALVGGRKHAEYLKKMGFPDDRIFLGYDVVDNDYFEREASSARLNEQDLRSRFNFPQNYFFACTRFIARKNIDGLLRAYAGYRKVCSTQPWGLVIAGDGEDIDLLQELQNRLGIDGILWPGFLQYEELPVYYGLASAFIHPARLEPWGLVVNEAAASGLPLLVSKAVNAGKELVKEGENGFLFEPRQDADITRVLLEMTNASSKQRQAMSTCSKEIAAQWTPGRFGKQLFAAVQGARRSML